MPNGSWRQYTWEAPAGFGLTEALPLEVCYAVILEKRAVNSDEVLTCNTFGTIESTGVAFVSKMVLLV